MHAYHYFYVLRNIFPLDEESKRNEKKKREDKKVAC